MLVQDRDTQCQTDEAMTIYVRLACMAGMVMQVVSRFFRKFISSASKYRNQIYGFSSSFGCSISILNRCSMSI